MHTHDHTPHLTATGVHRQRLIAVLVVVLAVGMAEVAGAVLSGSLALLADAGHLATDAAGIGLSLLAINYAARPPTVQRTFGYQRAEVLAALGNALLLSGVAAVVLVEAVRRLIDPPPVAGPAVLVFAAIAVLGNLVAMLLLARGRTASITLKAVFLELLGDALGSGAVLLAGALIAITGQPRIDAVAAIAVAGLIVPRVWRLLREVMDVLLETAPAGVDMAHVRAHVLDVPGVVDLHELHAWTITSGLPVLSAHVVIDEATVAAGEGGRVLDNLCDCLADHFDVEHCTFQLEPAGHVEHERGGHPCG
ncbi:MAG: cation transporter [Pseudonocardiales bacterium]|nr:MAG: cation transporter [Pseudonocardiales bacterium]